MKKNYEYKTVDLFMFPMCSEVSQYEIQKKCNELAKDGWKLVSQEIYDVDHILLTFKR